MAYNNEDARFDLEDAMDIKSEWNQARYGHGWLCGCPRCQEVDEDEDEEDEN